jgi:hypothetical protein
MLTFKSLIINNVDVWKSLLTSVLTFNSLAINDVDLVDLYMRIYHMHLDETVTLPASLLPRPHRGRVLLLGIAQRTIQVSRTHIPAIRTFRKSLSSSIQALGDLIQIKRYEKKLTLWRLA